MPLVHTSVISHRISSLGHGERLPARPGCGSRPGHEVRLGVNLSPAQLQSGDLAAAVAAVLEQHGYSPHLLELEVTENILLEDGEMALDTFRRVQELGVHIAFDDFGTGYASLTYLKKFPLDRLKIDQSFVRNLRGDSDDAAIVGCTINLGTLLGLSGDRRGHRGRRHRRIAQGHGLRGGAGLFLQRAAAGSQSSSRRFLSRDGSGDAAPGTPSGRDRGLGHERRAHCHRQSRRNW